MKAKVTAATLILARVGLDMLRSRRSRREGPLGEPPGVRMQEPIEVRGAPAVADTFSGRARAARPALVNGAVGAVWAPGGRPRVVFDFTVRRGKIAEIHILADSARLRQVDLAVLDA